MSKRHPLNTNLTVISNGQYQGLNVNPRPLSAEYLDAILQTLQAAMNEHPRTFMVRFDLHLPQLNFRDSPVVYDSTVISKFFKSLNAKIQHDRLIKGREGKRVHPSTQRIIWEFLGMQPDNPDSWYVSHPMQKGLMVNFFDHPILEKNRSSARIKKAYEQLYQSQQIYKTIDKVSFNPPVTSTYSFKGSSLHWDVSLQQPIPTLAPLYKQALTA